VQGSDQEAARAHHGLRSTERDVIASRATLSHLTAAVDSMDSHVCVLDADGRILWVNESWRRFAIENGGRLEACCEGVDCFALPAPSPGPAGGTEALLPRLRDVLDGRCERAEIEYCCEAPGGPRWFRASIRGYHERGQRRAVVSHLDITAAKLAEAERAAAEQQRHEAHKLEVIGSMASGIAHDFNNILTAIVGNLDLARMQAEVGSSMREVLDEIGKASERARDLVRQILAFRPQRQQTRRLLPLAPLIEEATAMLRAGAGRDQRVELQLAPVPPLPIDPTQIHQVVLNLLTNANHAIRCRADGGGTIAVELTAVELAAADARRLPVSEPGPHARIRVRDTGPGIAADLLPRIFDPYFTTKPAGKGNGIGLTLAKAIVRDHGGSIDVHSELGVGTTFDVYLPLAAAGR
jgi:signal transduction histidine kinase